MERNGLLPTLLLTTQNASSIGEPIDYGVCREMLEKSIGNTWYKDILYLAFFNTIQNEIDTPSGITYRLYKRELRNQAIVVKHKILYSWELKIASNRMMENNNCIKNCQTN
jgi:hypothetical protein